MKLQLCPWEGKNIHVLRGFFVFFLNSANTKLPMGFEKNKAYIGVFLSF
jgi:hypothetical protein